MMSRHAERYLVAVYARFGAAKMALDALAIAGVDMSKLSVVGMNERSEMDPRAEELSGPLFGSAVFFLPAMGPLAVMGPLVGWIAAAPDYTVVGTTVGVLGTALMRVGLTRDDALKCELAVAEGSLLLLARGPPKMVRRVRTILAKTNYVRVNG